MFIVHDGEKQVQYFVGDAIKVIDSTENEASCCDKVNDNSLPASSITTVCLPVLAAWLFQHQSSRSTGSIS